MGVSIVSIVESVAVLLMEALGDDVFVGGLCTYSVVGLRVSFGMVYNLVVCCWNRSSQQLLLPLLQPFLTTSPRYFPLLLKCLNNR